MCHVNNYIRQHRLEGHAVKCAGCLSYRTVKVYVFSPKLESALSRVQISALYF